MARVSTLREEGREKKGTKESEWLYNGGPRLILMQGSSSGATASELEMRVLYRFRVNAVSKSLRGGPSVVPEWRTITPSARLNTAAVTCAAGCGNAMMVS